MKNLKQFTDTEWGTFYFNHGVDHANGPDAVTQAPGGNKDKKDFTRAEVQNLIKRLPEDLKEGLLKRFNQIKESKTGRELNQLGKLLSRYVNNHLSEKGNTGKTDEGKDSAEKPAETFSDKDMSETFLGEKKEFKDSDAMQKALDSKAESYMKDPKVQGVIEKAVNEYDFGSYKALKPSEITKGTDLSRNWRGLNKKYITKTLTAGLDADKIKAIEAKVGKMTEQQTQKIIMGYQKDFNKKLKAAGLPEIKIDGKWGNQTTLAAKMLKDIQKKDFKLPKEGAERQAFIKKYAGGDAKLMKRFLGIQDKKGDTLSGGSAQNELAGSHGNDRLNPADESGRLSGEKAAGILKSAFDTSGKGSMRTNEGFRGMQKQAANGLLAFDKVIRAEYPGLPRGTITSVTGGGVHMRGSLSHGAGFKVDLRNRGRYGQALRKYAMEHGRPGRKRNTRILTVGNYKIMVHFEGNHHDLKIANLQVATENFDNSYSEA